MGLLAIAGVGSTPSVASFVDELMRIEQRPADQLRSIADRWSARRDAWRDVATRLDRLDSAADSVTDPLIWSNASGMSNSEWIDGVVKRVRGFVDRYNDVIDSVTTQTRDGGAGAAGSGPLTVRPLLHDTAMQSIASGLRRAASDPVLDTGQPLTLLSSVGVAPEPVLARDSTGRLELDESKLRSVLASSPDAVRAVFAAAGDDAAPTSEDGIARRVSKLVDNYRQGGIVDLSIEGAGRQVQLAQGSIDRMNVRLGQRRARYERMFASMQQVISRGGAQMQWLDSQVRLLGASNGQGAA